MTLSLCRFALAFIWIYQGIVPKWLGPHDDELAMNQVLGASHEQAVWIAYGGGALEVGLGLAILVWWRRRWPYQLSALGIGLLSVFVLWLAVSVGSVQCGDGECGDSGVVDDRAGGTKTLLKRRVWLWKGGKRPSLILRPFAHLNLRLDG